MKLKSPSVEKKVKCRKCGWYKYAEWNKDGDYCQCPTHPKTQECNHNWLDNPLNHECHCDKCGIDYREYQVSRKAKKENHLPKTKREMSHKTIHQKDISQKEEKTDISPKREEWENMIRTQLLYLDIPLKYHADVIKLVDAVRTQAIEETVEEIEGLFLKYLTVDSKDNQAIFNDKEGWQVFNGTDLDMVMDKFKKAKNDLLSHLNKK